MKLCTAISILLFLIISCSKEKAPIEGKARDILRDCIKHSFCCDGTRDDLLVSWCSYFRIGTKWKRNRDYNPDTIYFINDSILNWTNQYGGIVGGKYKFENSYLYLYENFRNEPVSDSLANKQRKFTYYNPETGIFTIVFHQAYNIQEFVQIQ